MSFPFFFEARFSPLIKKDVFLGFLPAFRFFLYKEPSGNFAGTLRSESDGFFFFFFLFFSSFFFKFPGATVLRRVEFFFV